jgi:hypothetical protein
VEILGKENVRDIKELGKKDAQEIVHLKPGEKQNEL